MKRNWDHKSLHYTTWKSVTMCEVKLRCRDKMKGNDDAWTQIKMKLHDTKYSKEQWKCTNWNEDGVRWDKMKIWHYAWSLNY